MLSHGACGDSQKAQVPGRTGHPQPPPTLVTQADWALLGAGGICSPKAPTPSVGGQAGATGRATTENAAAGPLLAAPALGTVCGLL